MEEPPVYMTFILATTEIHKIPDTIISRCQTFQFRHLTVPQLEARLNYIATEENIPTEKEAITLIAKTAE
jgi:DNA polymerase-3 subunit gamma/tau